MNDPVYTDPATGRRYTTSPDGSSRWVDDVDVSPPAPQPAAGFPDPRGGQPGHGRPAAARKAGKGRFLLGGVLGLILGFTGGAVVGGAVGGASTGTSSTLTGPASAEPIAPAANDDASSEPAPAPAGITKDNFTVDVKTLSKQCFGSAGCNVEVRLVVAGDASIKGTEVELSIEVSGDESGPLIETIAIDEDGQYTQPELVVSTKSSKTKVKATITDVETF